jgi:hypothetical protein
VTYAIRGGTFQQASLTVPINATCGADATCERRSRHRLNDRLGRQCALELRPSVPCLRSFPTHPPPAPHPRPRGAAAGADADPGPAP